MSGESARGPSHKRKHDRRELQSTAQVVYHQSTPVILPLRF